MSLESVMPRSQPAIAITASQPNSDRCEMQKKSELLMCVSLCLCVCMHVYLCVCVHVYACRTGVGNHFGGWTAQKLVNEIFLLGRQEAPNHRYRPASPRTCLHMCERRASKEQAKSKQRIKQQETDSHTCRNILHQMGDRSLLMCSSIATDSQPSRHLRRCKPR